MNQPKIITSIEEQYQKIKDINASGSSKTKCSVSKSNGVLIDQYLKEQPSLQYFYGDNPPWEHVIEVIAIREDYREVYPKLLSFTGENVLNEAKGVAYFNELTYYKQNNIENSDLNALESKPKMNLNLVNIYLQASFFRRILKGKKKEKKS